MAQPEDRFAGITFVDMQEREYFARARLGVEMEDFLRSDVGRYLHGCAKQEIELARTKLEECNPDSFFGRRKIRRLQREIHGARNFMRWVSEALQDGVYATQQLESYRSES